MLGREGPRERLLEALEGIERLVLLGDVAELRPPSIRRGLAAAEPVLRALGRRLGAGSEVVIVPGNHDDRLVRGWVRTRGRELGLDEAVPLEGSRALARLASWLAPARVRVRYPGVWLGEGVWASHGHYLNRHLVPDSTYGLPRPGYDDGPARPFDYEDPAHRRRSPAGRLAARVLEPMHTTVVPVLPHLLLNARLAPVNAALIDLQVRRIAVAAMARVATRLGVEAEWVLFGHTHRTGPLPGDDEDTWRPLDGGPRLVNCGSWMWEQLLLERARAPHPYWPGGAVLLEPGAPPRVLTLLDDIARQELIGGAAIRRAAGP